MIEYVQMVLLVLLALVGVCECIGFLVRRFWRRRARYRLFVILPVGDELDLEDQLRSARQVIRWWDQEASLIAIDQGATPEAIHQLQLMDEPLISPSELSCLLLRQSAGRQDGANGNGTKLGTNHRKC